MALSLVRWMARIPAGPRAAAGACGFAGASLRSVAATLLLGCAGAASALPLSEALRLALTGHPALEARRSEIGAAGFDIKSAEWKRYPTLTVEASQLLTKPRITATNSSMGAQTVRLDQRLYTFGRISAEIDAATLRQQAAEWALLETEQDLLTRVVQAYTELLRAGERAAIARRNIDEHQRLVDLIQRRLDAGVSSEVDVALAQARLQQASAEMSVFRAAAANARATLEQLTGVRVTDADMPPLPTRLKWETARDALDQGVNFSPTLRRLNVAIALAQVDLKARRAAIFPEVLARYEHFGGSASVVPTDRLMIVLQYQPGAGLSQVPLVDAAQRRTEGATSGLEAGRRDLIERITSQYNEAQSLLEQIGPVRGTLRATSDVMESYLRQYTAGRKTWQEVLNAQRELTQASYSVVDTEYAARGAALRLDVLTGYLSRSTLQAANEAPAAAAALPAAPAARPAEAGAPAAAAQPAVALPVPVIPMVVSPLPAVPAAPPRTP